MNMKKYTSIVILLFLLKGNIFSVPAGPPLNGTSVISLLTCSPGEELYSAFGHSAIRVHDSINKIDWVFNYGTFDFNAPNFYFKFIRGELNYQLTVEYYDNFIKFYSSNNRDVYQQVLNLDSLERQILFDYLIWNAEPANKFYLYDFFWDNCATRMRDAIVLLYKDKVRFYDKKWSYSYRQLVAPYLERSPWMRLGINLSLGMPADSIADLQTIQFLPDYVDTIFQETIIETEIPKKLISQRTHIIFSKETEKSNLYKYLNPTVVFVNIFIIILVISILEFRYKFRFHYIDSFLLYITGVLGILICFLWFGTLHRAANYNLNILWASPLNLFIAIFYYKIRSKKYTNIYLLIYSILCLLLVCIWNILPQQFDSSLIYLLLTMFVRFAGGFFYYNKK